MWVNTSMTNWKFIRHISMCRKLEWSRDLVYGPFFVPIFGDKNGDMTEMEKGVDIRNCLVWRQKTHTKGQR